MNDKEIIAAAEARWRKSVTEIYYKRLLDLAIKHQRTREANAKLRAFVESFARCPACRESRKCVVNCDGPSYPEMAEARQLLKETDR